MPPLLEAINLHKSYEKESARVEVLRGIDLSIEEGEKMIIVGASGVGKSTLLHILGGLDRPTEGSVCFEQKELFKKSESELAEFRNLHLGFVFQFHHLLPLFSALENVMMPCLIAGFSRREAKERALELLKEVGLEARIAHRPREMSGGEQQRVALARALVLKPKIVMADEPTGNLDTETSRRVFDQLIDLNERHKTTLIVVTHNEELASLLKRRIRIRDGKIDQDE
jgi:lipoprotein-releasing system ATP-binding protein